LEAVITWRARALTHTHTVTTTSTHLHTHTHTHTHTQTLKHTRIPFIFIGKTALDAALARAHEGEIDASHQRQLLQRLQQSSEVEKKYGKRKKSNMTRVFNIYICIYKDIYIHINIHTYTHTHTHTHTHT
jgi:hypothetical protein